MLKKPSDQNYNADYYTRFAGISARGMWTMQEVCPEEYRKLDSAKFQSIQFEEFEAGMKGWEEKAPGWEEYDNSYKSFNPDEL